MKIDLNSPDRFGWRTFGPLRLRRAFDHGTDHWHAILAGGRLQVGCHVMCHRSSHCSDRWVIHPSIVYDRKQRP